MPGTLTTWGQANFSWSNNSFTWGDIALVEEALGGGDMSEMPWTKWEDDKKEKLVKLICKVKGKTYKQTKQVKDIKITAKDIRLLAERVLGIEVITENVKF